jgi:hypothetical protein
LKEGDEFVRFVIIGKPMMQLRDPDDPNGPALWVSLIESTEVHDGAHILVGKALRPNRFRKEKWLVIDAEVEGERRTLGQSVDIWDLRVSTEEQIATGRPRIRKFNETGADA